MKSLTICMLLAFALGTATGCGKLTKRSGAEPTNTTEIEARGTVPEEEWDITMYDPEEIAKMRAEKAALQKAQQAREDEAALPTVAAIPDEAAQVPDSAPMAEPMASPEFEAPADERTIPATAGTPITNTTDPATPTANAPETAAPATGMTTAPAATTESAAPPAAAMQHTEATDLAYEKQADALTTTYVSGYRVQLMATTDAEKAMEFAEAVQPMFTESVYVEYQQPFYKVRVGDCQTREAAGRILSRVRANGFDEAWITETMVIQD